MFLDIDKWFNTKQCHESGMINMIQKGMKETGLNFYDYLYSKRLKKIELQYDRKIIRSSFYTKYKNILE